MMQSAIQLLKDMGVYSAIQAMAVATVAIYLYKYWVGRQ